MTRLRPTRTPRGFTSSTVRDDLKAGALLLAQAKERGVIDRLEGALPLARRGGHGARSLFGFAVSFLMAGPSLGIRPFTRALDRTSAAALAALSGVAVLPSSASVSRALSDLTASQVNPCIDALLVDDAGVARALASPHLLHRDARGHGWHVLDLDPTVSAFRQRDLPRDGELPAPARRAPGESGYTGRKRGEVRIRNVPLMHAGAGLWLANRMVEKEGSLVEVVAALAKRAKQVLPASPCLRRAVVRADGEFGSVGAIGAVMDAGLDVLTRLSRYKLLDTTEAASVLAGNAWHDVPDSLGGSRRQAAELGTFRLERDGGARASTPVEVRVVVTRRPRAGDPDHGVVREGWQLELFATTLSAEEWPAEDVVALYSGRSVLENRFAQEDREFGLGRTFSYNPAGQEWMVGVGLYLWNVLVLRGLELAPLPAREPPQERRPIETPIATPSPPSTTTASREMEEAVTADDRPASPPPKAPRVTPAERELWAITCDVFGDLKAAGWTFNHDRRAILCPNHKPLRLTCVRVAQRCAVLLARKSDCLACPRRASCISARKPGAPTPQMTKGVSRRVSVATIERLLALREAIRGQPKRTLASERDLPPPKPPVHQPPAPRATGPFLPGVPLFLPSESRKLARDTLARIVIEFRETPHPEPRRRRHPLLARDDADRQHRRLSWSARRARWAPLATVEVRPMDSTAARALRRILGV